MTQKETLKWKQLRNIIENFDSSYTRRVAFHTIQLWEWVNNDSKESAKVECLLGDKGNILQETCVAVTPEE